MIQSREDFLDTIYLKYARKLENMCLQYVNYQEEYRFLVDDSIQKTYEKATQMYKELQESPYLEGWLCQTCMYRLTTSLRTYRRRQKCQVSLDDDHAYQLPPEQIADAVDEIVNRISNQELIDKIFEALNDRERDIAQRHLIQGLTIDDIAVQDHTSSGAVKAVLARLRAKAKKIRSKNLQIFFMIFVSILHIARFKK